MNQEYSVKRIIAGRFPTGEDLLEQIENICEEENIRMGAIHGIGALSEAVIGYFNQKNFEYETREIKEPMEILMMFGNISIKEGKSMPHVHLTLGDKEHKAHGGHLMPGCRIFVCEYVIHEYQGEPLERKPDAATTLPLWPV